MSEITVLEVRESILNNNDALAEENREYLKNKKTFLVNLMGSPGAGKTTVLAAAIERLREDYRIGIIEADVDSDVDAKKLASCGVEALQLHTGGLCHVDAKMAGEGIKALKSGEYDLVFLENIGNLVCPAEFDIGAALKVMILSVPEGDDKPLKYPLMFETSDCLLVNKTDTEAVFDFDYERMERSVRAVNPDMEIFRVSALEGDGIERWTEYLKKCIEEWKKL